MDKKKILGVVILLAAVVISVSMVFAGDATPAADFKTKIIEQFLGVLGVALSGLLMFLSSKIENWIDEQAKAARAKADLDKTNKFAVRKAELLAVLAGKATAALNVIDKAKITVNADGHIEVEGHPDIAQEVVDAAMKAEADSMKTLVDDLKMDAKEYAKSFLRAAYKGNN